MTYRDEMKHTIHGVPGRFKAASVWPEGVRAESVGLFSTQSWISEGRRIPEYDRNGKQARIYAEIRFDDNCKNGHHTFAITAHVQIPGARDWEACGCLHDDIVRIFPELARLIPWHLCSADGPMHYEANALYHAGDRDHNGKREGEPCRFQPVVMFGANPVKHSIPGKFSEWLQEFGPQCFGHPFDFEVISVPHKNRDGDTYDFTPKFTFGGFGCEWYQCPFDTEGGARDFLQALQECSPRFLDVPTAWSKGKARDLDAARNVAIWPDATDEELMQDKETLRATLQARLPALVAAFRDEIEATGFHWSPRG